MQGSATIILPVSVDGRIKSYSSEGFPAVAPSPDGCTVRHTALGPLPPGKQLEVLVTFPHGLVDAEVPLWERRVNPVFLVERIAFVFLGGVLLYALLWVICLSRRRRYSRVPRPVFRPSSVLTVAEASPLEAAARNGRALVASVMEMCQTRVLRTGLYKKPKGVTRIHLVVTGEYELVWERRIGGIVRLGMELPLPRNAWASERAPAYAEIGEHLVHGRCSPLILSLAYWRASAPDGRRVRLPLWILVVEAVIAGRNGSILWYIFGSALLALLVLRGASALVRRVGEPLPTDRGSVEIVHWCPFRDYLTNRPVLAGREFGAYLPYAVAFGIADSYLGHAADLGHQTQDWLELRSSSFEEERIWRLRCTV